MKEACINKDLGFDHYIKDDWRKKDTRPKIKDPLLEDLLIKMINPSIYQRIGYERILSHPYFKQFDLPIPKPIERYFNERLIEVSFKDVTDISKKMITTLFEWMVEVALKFRMQLQTLFLAFHLVYLFLMKKKDLKRDRLQMIGCVCVHLASKVLESFPAMVQDYVYKSANSFSDKDFIQMEEIVFNALSGNVFVATPFDYYQQMVPKWKQAHLEVFLNMYLTESDIYSIEPKELALSIIKGTNSFIKISDTIKTQASEYMKVFNELPPLRNRLTK